MTEQTPWLLIDLGNTAIKWRLANAEGLLDSGGSVSDVSSLCKAIEAETGVWRGWRVLPVTQPTRG